MSMQITRAGTQPSQQGPADWFTGPVRIDPLFQPKGAPKDSARASAAYVTFEPCARSAWHTHPLGQLLVVTAGVGRVQQWGGSVEEIRAGDVVWPPAGVKHWHGASPTAAMTHLAITEVLDGKAMDWMEKVTDAEYGVAVTPAAQATSTGTGRACLAEVAPGLAAFGDRVVLGELWKRPDLSPRDRSLVTVSALVASGQVAQITYHLNRAMDAGLTKAQAPEMLTQLAFYAGWPNVFSAMPVAKAVFEKRPQR